MGFRDLAKGLLGIREPRRNTRDDDHDYRRGRDIGRSLPPVLVEAAQPYARDITSLAREADRARRRMSQGVPLTRSTSVRADFSGPVSNLTPRSVGATYGDRDDYATVEITPRTARGHTRTRSHGRTDLNSMSYRPRSSHDTARVSSSTTWQDGDFSHLRGSVRAGRRNSMHVTTRDSYGGTDTMSSGVRYSEHRGTGTGGATITTPSMSFGGAISGHRAGERSKTSFVDGRPAPRGYRFVYEGVRQSGRIKERLEPK